MTDEFEYEMDRCREAAVATYKQLKGHSPSMHGLRLLNFRLFASRDNLGCYHEKMESIRGMAVGWLRHFFRGSTSLMWDEKEKKLLKNAPDGVQSEVLWDMFLQNYATIINHRKVNGLDRR